MSDSNRSNTFTIVTGGTIVALFLLLLLTAWDSGAIHARNDIEGQRYAAEYATDTENRIEQDCSNLEGAALTDCVTEIITASHEHQRAEADLAAQRNMAQWAYVALIIALSSVIVTGIGVVFVALTLREARKTTSAAIDAAKAADKTVETTWEIGKAQIAAYLTCVSARYKVNKDGIFLTANIVNTGYSPATECRISALFLIANPDYRPNDDRAYWIRSKISSAGYASYIPAKMETATEISMVWAWSSAFDRIEYDRFLKDGRYFEVECKIIWRTVFENDWHEYHILLSKKAEEGHLPGGKDGLPSRHGTLTVQNMMAGNSLIERGETY